MYCPIARKERDEKGIEGGLSGRGTYKKDIGVHFCYLDKKKTRHVLAQQYPDVPMIGCLWVLFHGERWLELLEGRVAEDLMCM